MTPKAIKLNLALATILLSSITFNLSGASPSPHKGGPFLYIDNKMRSKVYVRNIPTQYYGKQGVIIYYSPEEFGPLEAGSAKSHDFFSNQWFGCPGSKCSKITLINDDPVDASKWAEPLVFEMNANGISNAVFQPNKVPDKVNKKGNTMQITYNVNWNTNGWQISLKDEDVAIEE